MRLSQEMREAMAPTKLDRFIESVAPGWGVQRRKARFQLAMSETYHGASRTRRQSSEWKTVNASPDDSLLDDVDTLRDRSHDQHRNSAIARGIFGTSTTAVVGTGLKMTANINYDVLGITPVQAAVYESMLEAEFAAWFESKFVDLSMEQTGYELQGTAFRNYMIDGDCFAILPMKQRYDQPYQTCVQLIEAARVSNPDWKQDTELVRGGIEFDADGVAQNVHITNKHPQTMGDKTVEWKPYRVRTSRGLQRVLHVYDRLFPGQTRGEPLLAPVLEPLKMLSKYTEAELMATVLASMFTVFVKTETGQKFGPMEGTPEAAGPSTDPSVGGYKLGVGAIVGLANNESIEVADPKRPNTGYDAFFESILRQVGMALEIPFELLIKHFTASYSAARAAMLEAWRAFMTRRVWFANRFCQPIYEAWVEESVALGRINLPGYLQADAIQRQAWLGTEWVGPGRGQIDEMKEAQAADFRIKAGLSTKSIEVPNLTGRDWEDVQKQLAREKQTMTELGTSDAPAGTGMDDNGDTPQKEKDGGDKESTDKPEGGDSETPKKEAA